MAHPNTQIQLFHVDAFTSGMFHGNPCAVILSEIPLSDQWMQNLAAEFNTPDSAFLWKNADTYNIRFFTPDSERKLSGHASISAAQVLYNNNYVSKTTALNLEAGSQKIHLEYQSGTIHLWLKADTVHSAKIPPAISECFHSQPLEFYLSSSGWKIARFDNEMQVREIQADPQLLLENDLDNLIVTAPGESDNTDYVLRVFNPGMGVAEDPATGIAHMPLAVIWKNLTNTSKFHVEQLSDRHGKADVEIIDAKQVRISTKAVEVFSTRIALKS